MATLNHQWIPDLHHIQECLISLAKTAGSMILSAHPTSSDTLTKKSSVDLVTATDAAVETMIFNTLRSNYPMCDLMGEESYRQGIKLTNAPTFIVDPIDGTTNFVHGNAYVAVSLGFTLNRTPMVGVVFSPFTQHLYTAIEGEGSFLTDYTFEAEIPKIRTRRLPLRQPLEPLCGLRGALVALEWGNEREGPNWECQVNTAKRLGASEKQGGAMVHSVRNLGSAALNICAVAEGSIDVYWEGGIWAWDVCAGWVVLKEAGGVIVDGNPGRWGNEIMVDHRKYLAVRAVGNGNGGRSQQQIVEEFWSFVEGTMVCIFRFDLTFLLGHGPNFHYLSSKDTPGPPKIANVLYGNLSYQYFAGLGLGSMTSLSSFTQTCPIPDFTIFVPQIAPTCEILEVTTTIHLQYQEPVSSDLAYSFLEMTQPGSAPANDFDTRTEKKLEQLKHVEIDQSWFTVLPSGASIKETIPHGESFYARSARIIAELPSGETKSYFLKLATEDLGLAMLKGEYESMKALNAVSPDFVPKPVGHGTYASDPNIHFFMVEFVPMANELPDVVKFCSMLADLHQRSIAQSPNGKFGFDITTYNAKLPQDNTWNESWEAFHLQGLKQLFELEEESQGPSEELKQLLPALYEKVVPRLLRPMETEGRELKPCLIHGDLWDGNVAVNATSKSPLIFDASAFWAHNECELGMWRPARFKMRDEYITEYFNHFPKTPPEEDWDDRNLLYSLRPDIQDSALFPSTTRFRELILTTVRYLVEKYPNGYEGSAPRKGSA